MNQKRISAEKKKKNFKRKSSDTQPQLDLWKNEKKLIDFIIFIAPTLIIYSIHSRRLSNIVFIGRDGYLYHWGTHIMRNHQDNIAYIYLTFYRYSIHRECHLHVNITHLSIFFSSFLSSIFLQNIFPSANFKFKIAIFFHFYTRPVGFSHFLSIHCI